MKWTHIEVNSHVKRQLLIFHIKRKKKTQQQMQIRRQMQDMSNIQQKQPKRTIRSIWYCCVAGRVNTFVWFHHLKGY